MRPTVGEGAKPSSRCTLRHDDHTGAEPASEETWTKDLRPLLRLRAGVESWLQEAAQRQGTTLRRPCRPRGSRGGFACHASFGFLWSLLLRRHRLPGPIRVSAGLHVLPATCTTKPILFARSSGSPSLARCRPRILSTWSASPPFG